MTDYRKDYDKWAAFDGLDTELAAEIAAIKDDDAAIRERFSSPLAFGTAGLRGILRAGTNGMNVFTVAQATQGLAALVKKHHGEERGVVIACDTRHKSDEFSRVCARVLAANGVKAYLFDGPRPTPELSFALRHLRAISGINITASHNPKEYNGYKAYWEDGAQISPEQAAVVSDAIASVDIFTGVKSCDFDEAVRGGKIVIIGKDVDEAYLTVVLAERIHKDAIPAAKDLKVVYTPFHGTGYRLVPEALLRAGLKKENFFPVPEQMIPDGDFPTVKSPNPEDKAGFALAVEIAKREGANLLIGTDPDADRTGVIVRTHEDEFLPLSGNQIGAMMLAYIIDARQAEGRLPAGAAAVRSIVSTPLADRICEANGVTLVEVLTGFKFIGEKIKEWESTHEHTFIFGFEESYGYLSGTYARDKDAVCASLLITEMAAYYAAKGLTLYDVLCGLFEKYGRFKESVESLAFPGLDGAARMKTLMNGLRNDAPKVLAGETVAVFADYLRGVKVCGGKEEPTGLPLSDVLFFGLANGDRVYIRPSGTEPKVKVYYLVSAKDEKAADEKIAALKGAMKALTD